MFKTDKISINAVGIDDGGEVLIIINNTDYISMKKDDLIDICDYIKNPEPSTKKYFFRRANDYTNDRDVMISYKNGAYSLACGSNETQITTNIRDSFVLSGYMFNYIKSREVKKIGAVERIIRVI